MAEGEAKRKSFLASLGSLAYNTFVHPLTSINSLENRHPVVNYLSSTATILGGVGSFTAGLFFTFTGNPVAGVPLMIFAAQNGALAANAAQAIFGGSISKAAENVEAQGEYERRTEQPIFKRKGLSFTGRLSTKKDRAGEEKAVPYQNTINELNKEFGNNPYITEKVIKAFSKEQIQSDKDNRYTDPDSLKNIRRDEDGVKRGFFGRIGARLSNFFARADHHLNTNYTDISVQDAVNHGYKVKANFEKKGFAFYPPDNKIPTDGFREKLNEMFKREKLIPSWASPEEKAKLSSQLVEVYSNKIREFTKDGSLYKADKLIDLMKEWERPLIHNVRNDRGKIIGLEAKPNPEWKYINGDGTVKTDEEKKQVFVVADPSARTPVVRFTPRAKEKIEAAIKGMFDDVEVELYLREKGFGQKDLMDPNKKKEFMNALANAILTEDAFDAYGKGSKRDVKKGSGADRVNLDEVIATISFSPAKASEAIMLSLENIRQKAAARGGAAVRV